MPENTVHQWVKYTKAPVRIFTDENGNYEIRPVPEEMSGPLQYTVVCEECDLSVEEGLEMPVCMGTTATP
jgi:hypothetical protein